MKAEVLNHKFSTYGRVTSTTLRAAEMLLLHYIDILLCEWATSGLVLKELDP